MLAARDLGPGAALIGLAALGLAGCGEGGDIGADGGIPGCQMSIAVSPTAPVVGDLVTLDGAVFDGGGFETYQWQVLYDGQAVTLSGEGDLVTFTPTGAGIHSVRLDGSAGTQSCVADIVELNILPPGAQSRLLRLRVVPPPDAGLPIQEQLLDVPVGVDEYSVGAVALGTGVQVTGTVSAEGAGVPAYLRVRAAGDAEAPASETFADASGMFSVNLIPGNYEVLVVPDALLAPVRLPSRLPSQLASIPVDAGDLVTGTVRDPGGAPLAGAAVSLRIDGVISTVATTDAGGSFALRARLGGATAVTVVPPAASGLPRLALDAAAGLVASGAPLDIRYAAELATRTVAPAITAADGQVPAPGARVTWIASEASAGTIEQGGPALPLAGRVRVVALADADGLLPGTALPAWAHDVLVEPGAGGAAALRSIDLRAGQPAPGTIALAEAAVGMTGVVVDEGGDAIESLVTAEPTGVLADAGLGPRSVVTGADGSFTLQVVAGGTYQLRVSAAAADHAGAIREVAILPEAASAALGDIALEQALRLGGRLERTGVGVGGAVIELRCLDCGAARPLATAVSDADGRFRLAVPAEPASERAAAP